MTTHNVPVAAFIGAGMVARTHVAACADAHDKLRLKGISGRTPDRASALSAGTDLGPLSLVETNVPWRRERSCCDEPGRGTYARGGGADPMAFTHAWHQTILENFAAVVTGSAPALAKGREALAAHDLIDAITRSSQTKTIEYLAP